MEKAPDAFRTISEVAEDLDVPQHVLRFWETRFSQIRPMKRGGGRRYYRVNDVDLLKGIRQLLYGKGYTIKGVQRILKDRGVAHVADVGRGIEHSETESGQQGETSTSGTASTATSAAAGKKETAPDLIGLSADQRKELELALADLAAAGRILQNKN